MLLLLISISTFIVGFCLGNIIKTKAFNNQDWDVLKWNKNCLGYRTVSLGEKLNRGDRIIMALHLKTDSFPEDGILYDVDVD